MHEVIIHRLNTQIRSHFCLIATLIQPATYHCMSITRLNYTSSLCAIFFPPCAKITFLPISYNTLSNLTDKSIMYLHKLCLPSMQAFPMILPFSLAMVFLVNSHGK